MHKNFQSNRLVTTVIIVAFVIATVLFTSGSKVTAGSLSFSGTIQTPEGAVYSGGGNINLWNNSTQLGYGSSLNADGNFEITGISAGTYVVNVNVNSTSYAYPPEQSVTITSSVSGFIIKAANPVIRGTIALPDGTPSNGCVNVHDLAWTLNRNSCPGSDGVFRIGGIGAGTYVLTASVPENSAYVNSDRTVTIIDPSTTLDLGLVKFDAPFIVGKVALPDGTLVPWSSDYSARLHLSVDLWNADQTVNKHSDYDSASNFKFGSVPAGTYTVHVNIWDTELYTGSENVSLTVGSGAVDLTGTPIRLTIPQLSGVVYRPDGVTPLPNVNVNVHNADQSLRQDSNTDQNGKYRIGGLPAGTYTLEVNPPNDANDVVRPDPVEITITTSNKTHNITMSTARKFVSGKVKYANGTGVACARINANMRGGNGWANTRTAADGSYSLTLPSGSWNLRVERDGGFDCPEANWIYLDQDAVVEFTANATEERETANFTVTKATTTISGKVLKKDGTPVTNGNVNANSQTQDGRNRNFSAQIKTDGTYKLYLVAGTYDLNLWMNDPRYYVKNTKVTVSDNKSETVNFTMSEKLAHIKGTVTSKAGAPLSGIQLNGNLDCGPQGCSAWSNTTTDASGNFDMAATIGRWNINFDSGRGANYVYDGPQIEVSVPSETATVTGVSFSLTYADVIIKGKVVDENGKPFAEFSGWTYVRPLTVTADSDQREYGGPINQGTFNFRVPSSLFTQAELGIHTPSNSQYSSSVGQSITLVADATIEKDIMVKKNDAAIVGRIVDSSGLPLRSCNFRGEVFANTQNDWHGTQINADCTFEISLLAGTYMLGYNIDQSAGFLNRPPQNNQVTVTAGTRLQKDIPVLAGDSKVNVLVLNPDGSPARRTWVWADNHEEIDQIRQSGQKQSSQEFRGPGDTKTPEALLKYCSDKSHENECREFKMPPGSEGPGGCKDALACAQYCQKNKKDCQNLIAGKETPKSQAVKMSRSVMRRKAQLTNLRLVKSKAQSSAASDESATFEETIQSGTETNDQGVAQLTLLSSHEYTVNAGLPPDTGFMPPKTARVSLKNSKSSDVTLNLREADGRLSGFVTFNGTAVANGWIGCWSEDGNSNGTQINNGTYRLNYTFNSTYHCEANAQTGQSFLRSDEKIITVAKEKKKSQNFTLGAANFVIPPPVTESFDATSPHVITLGDGTSINIPANTIATSGTVTVSANPTLNIQSQQTAKPLGYGYNFEAKDSDNKTVSTFSNNVTITFKYTDQQLTDAGIDEGSLIPSYWDSASSTWKKPTNITQDTDNNTITITSNHFTSFAVVSSSGKGRGRNITAVTTKKLKNGTTQVVVGTGKAKKTFTPFPSYKGGVTVGTTNLGGKTGQIIAAAQADSSNDATTLKIFTVKGKLTQKITPWGAGYRSGVAMNFEDVTRDTSDDLVVAPKSGTEAKVYDLAKKKNYSLSASSARTGIMVSTLDLLNRGDKQIVTKAGNTLKTWNFTGKKFATFAYDTARRLRVTSSGIERVKLQPNIRSVSPGGFSKGKGTTVITLKGENFGSGSRVLFGSVAPKKVVAQGEGTLVVTVDRSKFSKKRYALTVVNTDGVQTTLQNRIQVK